jgi:betaine-aldehyde dehydrogenase
MPELSLPTQKHYIDGRPHRSGSETFTTYNPSTGAAIAQVYTATAEDIDLAIRTSLSAFQKWSQTPPIERSRILLRAVALLRNRNDFIARVETLDTGKAFCETSTVDVATGADVLEYMAGLGLAMGEGKTIQLRASAWVYTRKEPLGVCVGIGAWNYPIQMYVALSPQ